MKSRAPPHRTGKTTTHHTPATPAQISPRIKVLLHYFVKLNMLSFQQEELGFRQPENSRMEVRCVRFTRSASSSPSVRRPEESGLILQRQRQTEKVQITSKVSDLKLLVQSVKLQVTRDHWKNMLFCQKCQQSFKICSRSLSSINLESFKYTV